MVNSERDRRLCDASQLADAIRALGKVSDDHRDGYLHDRLMTAIDDICRQHNGGNQKTTFTKLQMEILKDISFQVLYIAQQQTRKDPIFINQLWKSFKALDPIKKVGVGFCALIATISTIWTLFVGGYTMLDAIRAGGFSGAFYRLINPDSGASGSIHQPQSQNSQPTNEARPSEPTSPTIPGPPDAPSSAAGQTPPKDSSVKRR